MASPTASKVDEREVTSRGQGGGDGDDQEIDMGHPPLTRQSSIYSLTLDEIQSTVCEPGKTFVPMNVDEFLNNIWSEAEEGLDAANSSVSADSIAAVPPNSPPAGTASSGGGGAPLHRQGSSTMPRPLCRKTVDEVWAEIHGEQEAPRNAANADRQPTLGEMTLEDFLIKAGVVQEGFGPALPQPPATVAAESKMQQSYGLPTSYAMGTGAEGPVFGHVVGPTVYHQHRPAVSEGRGRRYGVQPVLGVGSPVSPVSSDGTGGGQVDDSGYRGANGAVRVNGRKRGGDGGVERRQRRMIKNRESAARSRARKQAYTVELEAELNLLKEESAHLKEEERRAQARRKQMIMECMAEHARANMEKVEGSLRRCSSGPL